MTDTTERPSSAGCGQSRPGGASEDYYLRQPRDWKLSAEIDAMRPRSMKLYARLCGGTLARAHARSGDRVAIAAYLGKSSRFVNAVM